jgi:transcription initiation factor TFIIIB Brf1 subunit/transcription initiation factor TFIIB
MMTLEAVRCSNCQSTDVVREEVTVCNRCGFNAEFDPHYHGGFDEFGRWNEELILTCRTCGKDNGEDEIVPNIDWLCRACGSVGVDTRTPADIEADDAADERE